MDKYLLDFQPKRMFRQTNRQTNIRQSQSNTINSSITMKTRAFEQQKKLWKLEHD